jgi:hypothetical protein
MAKHENLPTKGRKKVPIDKQYSADLSFDLKYRAEDAPIAPKALSLLCILLKYIFIFFLAIIGIAIRRHPHHAISSTTGL